MSIEVIWSRPENERAGTPLLVLLHGYGADERDLFSLSEQLPPDLTVASVRGSLQAGPGYAWFPLAGDAEGNLSFEVQEVEAATAALAEWLDGVREAHTGVGVLGFSQGMAMATSLARHRPGQIDTVVGLSGFVVDPGLADPATAERSAAEFFHDEEFSKDRVPVFWGRDQADPLVPAAAVEYTHGWLTRHAVLTKVLYSGMWHGISAAEIKHVAEFLQATLLAPVK
nr:phospholipase [Psychromicrobium sp. YIM S02556]